MTDKVPSRINYTTFSNPMPDPLRAAMSHLVRAGARIGAAYHDAAGHHLTAHRGDVAAHVLLDLDHCADAVDWADGDLSWAVNRDGVPLPLERWSQVCAVFREAAE